MKFLNQTFFKGNRAKLSSKLEGGIIVVAAAGVMQKSRDTGFRFQQDSNFFYLTGVEEPDYILVIDIDNSEEFLIKPKTNQYKEVFDGAADDGALRQVSGIKTVLSNTDGWKTLEEKLKGQNHVHVVAAPDALLEHYELFTNPARAHLEKKILNIASVELNDISKQLAMLRQIKQDPEVKAIKEAIKVTKEAFLKVSTNVNLYRHEYEIEADIVQVFRSYGLDYPAYESIVASGNNSCVMHYHENSGLIHKNKTLLIDAGAQVDHYTADITRVFLPSDGNAKKVFEQVSSIQKEAMSIIKPGVNFKDYEQEVRKLYIPALKKLNLIDSDSLEDTHQYAPTATSHFLGLDVHDVGEYDQEFQPGMVLTVEPGIYVPEWGCGVRIEDDVLVTEKGIENLSASLPVSLEALQ